MSWRESAIDVVLEYEFCSMWGGLSEVTRLRGKEASVKRERMEKRRLELSALDDETLFEEARYSASQRGYERGQYDESYANSMSY